MATPNRHSGITALPVELVLHICSFISPQCVYAPAKGDRFLQGHASLSRLSRTCTRFRDIIQPIVFHSFSDAGNGPPQKQFEFFQLLTNRPDLGKHVKALYFCDPSYHIEFDNLFDTDQQFILDSVVQRGLPAPTKFWNDGCEEHHLLLIDLILTLVPNLEALEIPLDYNWNLNIIRHAATTTNQPLLPKLTTLNISHYYISGDCWYVNLDAIAALVAAAPNIQSISTPTPGHRGRESEAYSLAQLRRLEFDSNCAISPALLSDMLSSAPRLEVLSLHWDALDDAYDYCDDRRVTDVWDALEKCKGSLRELRLDVRDDTKMVHEDGPTWERSSLSDFENLQVLMVDGHALGPLRAAWVRGNRHARVDAFLSGLLPRGIREVVFWRLDGEAMREAMRRLARVVAFGRYPDLTRVVVSPGEKKRNDYGEWRNVDGWYAVREELEEEFGKGGVKFEIKSESGYWLSPGFV